jgi:hypothetical protein
MRNQTNIFCPTIENLPEQAAFATEEKANGQ